MLELWKINLSENVDRAVQKDITVSNARRKRVIGMKGPKFKVEGTILQRLVDLRISKRGKAGANNSN